MILRIRRTAKRISNKGDGPVDAQGGGENAADL
jgi:hypothetical protein